MVVPAYATSAVVGVRGLILQPWSRNWPGDRRARPARAGTMWPIRAAVGMGRSSSAVCVERMDVPSGLEMQIGDAASFLLMTGVSEVKKWDVQPVSRMAVEKAAAGGPQVGVGNNSELLDAGQLGLLVLATRCDVIVRACGFPLRHPVGAAGAASRRWSCEGGFVGGLQILSHPPMVFANVALG